jgi:hypothetical protein
MDMVNESGSAFSGSKGRLNAYHVWLGGLFFSVGFTLLIWLLGSRLQPFLGILLPDQGASWYYWKLPVRGFWTMFVVWTLYLGHQFSLWAAIYWAQTNIVGNKIPPTNVLTKYNVAAIVINVLFISLHLLETQLLFDGLAQDVPIWTSQYSVIIMLTVVLVIENPRRGLFLGKRAGKPFTARVSGFFRHTHMYIFAWALVYTFWFHPMAVDPQLLSGFLYMFLLLTQASLAYTRVHLDKRWIIALESYVAIHALIVAVYNTAFFGSADMWPMFFGGFAFMFAFTYQYALRMRREAHWLIIGLYAVFLAWLYLPTPIGYGRGLSYLTRLEATWIPVILYGLSAAFAGLAYGLVARDRPKKDSTSLSSK